MDRQRDSADPARRPSGGTGDTGLRRWRWATTRGLPKRRAQVWLFRHVASVMIHSATFRASDAARLNGTNSPATRPIATASPTAARWPRVCGHTTIPNSSSAVRVSTARRPRGGTAFSTATTGGPRASVTTCWLVGTVSMSKISGRHGMTTREERRAASKAAVSSRAGVSITTKSTPCASAVASARASLAGWASSTIGVEVSRRSLHLHAVACGSMSSTTVVWPACSAATASARASVVLPVPPF